MALGIIEALETEKGVDVLELEHNSTRYLHVLIEAMRLAFADSRSRASQLKAKLKTVARYYVTDPARYHVPVEELLSKVS